jgi:hypothetical protein
MQQVTTGTTVLRYVSTYSYTKFIIKYDNIYFLPCVCCVCFRSRVIPHSVSRVKVYMLSKRRKCNVTLIHRFVVLYYCLAYVEHEHVTK